MNLREFQAYQRRKNLPDDWWISVDGEVKPKTLTIREIEMRRSAYIRREIHLINSAEVEVGGDWEILDPERVLSLREAGMSLKPRQAATTASIAGNGSSAPFVPNWIRQNKTEAKRESRYYSKEEIQGIFLELSNETCRLEALKKRLAAKELSILERERDLNEKLSELRKLASEISHRERYVKSTEDQLIDRTYQHDLRQAELEQLMDDFNVTA